MYLNIIQLAESFGVEENVVESWVRKESLPAIEDRGRLLFDRRQVVDWAAQRGLVAKAGFLATSQSATGPAHRIESFLRAGGIWRDVPASEILNVLERALGSLPGTTPDVRKILVQRLRAPDGITWAPVGGGVALPHLRAHVALGRDAGLLAIVLLRDALPLAEAPTDGVPVTRLLFFIAPSPRAHLEMLAQLSAALTRGSLRELLFQNAPDAEIFRALATAENQSAIAKEMEANG
jgi:PTS system nitrogen regulatory IIA component